MDYYTKQNTNIGMQYQQVGESKYEGVNQYPINTQLKYLNREQVIQYYHCIFMTSPTRKQRR